MSDFCNVRTRNLHNDVTNCLDVTGTANHFESTAHFLQSDFSGLRNFCDVRLHFQNEILLVHSAVLAAFSSTFLEKLKKSENGSFDVDLKFLDKNSVKKVLDFIYFGKVTFNFDTLQNDLEVISYFGIGQLQDEIEKKLVAIARKGKCVEVLNLVTTNLKTIPHSPSTLLAVSDETVSDLVSILHVLSSTNQLSYSNLLSISVNSIVTIVSSRIPDSMKIDVINIALKWIYERRLNDRKASNILCGLTFGSMTYAELVHFRSSLIQTVIPVTLDIVCTHAEHSIHTPNPAATSISSFPLNDATSLGVATIPTAATLQSENFDDCNTAMSFTADDLRRLGFAKMPLTRQKQQDEK
ncbi:Protein CBG17941 [Caenorhabditis briggsae]|uniref:Protein CBG17941 n=1 Tax=Caenorhabditis briggsae TaxID=6238 RepID=A8XRY6_CAEBR|nr:Protein CBG17941 [Caenorhabditis briggsae]CAP35475.2 Protein CBG17941 [Caenorhabditis briggsae]